MEKKYIIVTKKDGKPIDDKQYTKEEFSKKAYELMKETGLDREEMDKTYDYKEVPTEQNTGAPQAANDEFTSKEDTSSKYEFSSKNDVHKASITEDVKGWNSTLDNLDQIPDNIASLVDSHKDQLSITEGKKGGNVAMKKNAIRVLYLYNEFLKFYNEYCSTEGELPTAIATYLRTSRTSIKMLRREWAFDVVKKDMTSIIEDMFKAIGDYYKSGDQSEIEEFYDEVNDFDDELANIHEAIDTLKFKGNPIYTQFARMLAEQDDDFKKACDGNPTPEAMSKYIMDIAVKKYHLTRIKMDYKDQDSTLGALDWASPEDKASVNVRLSENVDDYLNLKNKKILDTEDQKKVDEIKNKFMKGGMSQQDAQKEINGIVKAQRDKIKTSLKIFFGFMGINDPQKMNQFAGGLKRLDETEYKNNWIKLIENYKEAMKKNIEKFKQAHSNDMSAEDRDDCVNKLSELLGNADKMLEAANNSDSTALLSHATQICTCIAEVQKKTAEAKKAFGGA